MTRNAVRKEHLRPEDSPNACSAIDGMMALGTRRLSEEALNELADHLEVCAECSARFDADCPDGAGEINALREAPSSDLGARLAKKVLEHLQAFQAQKQQLKGIRLHQPLPSPRLLSEHHGQLARDQELRGKSHTFVVEELIGLGEFTETYTAKLLPTEGAEDRDSDNRVVIKIPRIPEDMSPEAAAGRLRRIQYVIQFQEKELQSLAGLSEVASVLDCGDYSTRIQDRPTESTFIASTYIDGVDLASHMAIHYSAKGQFCGLLTASDFARWARLLTQGVLEIHNRLVIHGDICPRNVLVSPEGRPVFIDVGESLFREVLNGPRSFNDHFYRAPEGIGTPSSDLFSLGGLFYFLATGQEPIGLVHTDKEMLKQHITYKIKEANPRLYQDDPGVADIIAMCLRKEERVQNAYQLLREIDVFWPDGLPAGVLDLLKSLIDPAETLMATGNSVFLAVAVAQILSLRRMFIDMSNGVFDVSGNSSDIRFAASALLRPLRSGDEFLTISLLPFWYPHNIGSNGRFLSNCRNAAAHGATIKRVFLLVEEDLANPYLEQIVAAQLSAAADLDPTVKPNFSVRYAPVSSDDRNKLIAQGKHFGLLVNGGQPIAMWPVYNAKDELVTLRFRSGLRQVEGLRKAFEDVWAQSYPLADLCLPSANRPIDALLENAG